MPQTMGRVSLTHGKASQDSENVKFLGFWGQEHREGLVIPHCSRAILASAGKKMGNLGSCINSEYDNFLITHP